MNRNTKVDEAVEDALVVYDDRIGIPWLRVLKRGFRHCFLVVRGPVGWILYNPMSHRTQFGLYSNMHPDDMAAFFRHRGYTVQRTRTFASPRQTQPWRLFTCVEAVKRGLGLRCGWVLTPWQLYKYMKKYPKYENILDKRAAL